MGLTPNLHQLWRLLRVLTPNVARRPKQKRASPKASPFQVQNKGCAISSPDGARTQEFQRVLDLDPWLRAPPEVQAVAQADGLARLALPLRNLSFC